MVKEMFCVSFDAPVGKAKNTIARKAQTMPISKRCFAGISLAKMSTQNSLLKPYNRTNITFIIECFNKTNFQEMDLTNDRKQ
ncbi:hypothetical protein GCM10009112_28620 [Marinomonas arenicola]